MKRSFCTICFYFALLIACSSCLSTPKTAETPAQSAVQTETAVQPAEQQQTDVQQAEETPQPESEPDITIHDMPAEQSAAETAAADTAETDTAGTPINEPSVAELPPEQPKPEAVIPENIAATTETKPVETKPVETKPVETKPVETKPVETKPVETAIKTGSSAIAAKPAVPKTAAKPKASVKPAAEKQIKKDTAVKPAQEEQKPETKKEIEITPSRSITIAKNQYLDAVYPGSSWIYLGETGTGSLFSFSDRKTGTSETSFSLHAERSGNTVLHFYKNDTLTGRYIDDYLAVTVEDTAGSPSHVTAPSYADAVPARPVRNRTVPAASAIPETASVTSQTALSASASAAAAAPVQTPSTTAGTSATAADSTAAVPVDTSTMEASDILAAAQKSFDAKDYPQALTLITSFFDKAADRIDEGLYLQGQILEQKSSVRNIKSAIECYDSIVKNWPASSLWQKASERSLYLKRFYINIR